MTKEAVPNQHYWQLYKAFCKGDRKAERELVNLLGGRLKVYLVRTRLFRQSVDAEDCVQTTWEKLLKCCGKPLEEEKGFWGWASTIAKNTAIDWHRAQKAQDYDELPEDLAADSQDDLDSPNILGNISSLPLYQRQAFWLWQHGYAYSEIAGILHRKEETVKTDVRYAKDKLKQLFNPE